MSSASLADIPPDPEESRKWLQILQDWREGKTYPAEQVLAELEAKYGDRDEA